MTIRIGQGNLHMIFLSISCSKWIPLKFLKVESSEVDENLINEHKLRAYVRLLDLCLSTYVMCD